MDKIITERNGQFYVTSNDDFLASVIVDLAKNNTAFPDITDLYEFKKNAHVDEKDKKGNVVRRHTKKDALRVKFADGSWTDVVRSEDDNYDPITAILYAIAKRLLGTPTGDGYVIGNGFMGKLKKYSKMIRNEEQEEQERLKRIKDKEIADKKAHEDAVKRRERSPSLGVRVGKLEDKIEKLVDALLSKNSKR